MAVYTRSRQANGWVAEFKDAANTQEIGKVGDPVQSQFGYHVMKVESREATPYDKLTTRRQRRSQDRRRYDEIN